MFLLESHFTYLFIGVRRFQVDFGHPDRVDLIEEDELTTLTNKGTHDIKHGGCLKKRRSACGQCHQCQAADCRKCAACKDMEKYGGPGTSKQKCAKRTCHYMK